jgi:hypothetical protein
VVGCGRIGFDASRGSAPADSANADSAPACPTCDQGLLAHWRFDEPAGPTVVDDVGGHDGTLTGTATLRPSMGELAGALQLDGSGYVRVNWDLAPAVSNAVTVAEWVRADSIGQTGNARYFSNYYYYSSDNGLLEVDNSDTSYGLRCVFHTAGSAGGWATVNTSTAQMAPLTWTHIACVYDGSQLVAYANGAVVGNLALMGMLSSTLAMPVAIGASTDSSLNEENDFIGMIDDVRIYGRGLDASEIAALAAQ